jgi:predicted DNA-binding transcriptional regulator YafY
MKRTDRMFAIVVDLQARRIVRAEDLAARYETSVRTIYRDVTALCEAGIPVVSLPGQGYALPADYFLPPLSLGVDEAVALLLGADYVGQTLDPAYRTAAGAAIAKIEAIVPAALRGPLAEGRRAMRLVGREPDERQLELLRVFRTAIGDRFRVRFRYRGRRTDDPAGRGDVARSIAPYALTHMHGHWYVVGHSQERDALRRFRLSRIDDALVTEERFELPPDFELGPPDPRSDLPVLVRLAFDASDLAAVEERLSGFGATLHADGTRCIAAFRTHSDSAVVSYVLGWGGAAHVLEPQSLRERVFAAAPRILENDPDTLLSGAPG